MIEETAFIDTDDEIILVVRYLNDVFDENNVIVGKKGDVIPFVSKGVNKMEMLINGVTVTTPHDALKFSDHQVTIKPRLIPSIYPNRSYDITVKAFDSRHIEGQAIISVNRPHASVKLHTVSSTS